jgi:hypothetical protein
MDAATISGVCKYIPLSSSAPKIGPPLFNSASTRFATPYRTSWTYRNPLVNGLTRNAVSFVNAPLKISNRIAPVFVIASAFFPALLRAEPEAR